MIVMATSNTIIGATSPIKILANIFISFIGAGILGLPYAFKEAGVIEGFVVMILVALISVKAMLMIVDCKYHIEQWLDIPHKPTKPRESKMTQIKLPSGEKVDLRVPLLDDSDAGTESKSFCCAYLIFIVENAGSYFPYLKRTYMLLILLPPLFLLALPRHLSKLAVFSIFAQISSIFAFAVVFWFDFEHFHVARFHPKEYSLQGLPFYFAVAIYCFEGAGMILSLEQSLAQRVRHRFKHYFISTMVAVTLLYIAFGASGYLSFGPETSDIITFNLPRNPNGLDFPSLVTGCLCVSLFLTYPIMMFPVLELLEARYVNSNSLTKGNFLRLFLVALTGLIVTVVPNFGTLMALIGSSCCTLLAFILPGWFHICIFRGNHISTLEKIFDIFLILLGIAGTIVGMQDALMRMSSPHHHIAVMTTQITLSSQETAMV
ncbi:hypothetical protein B566_EDAN002727 [Ephemera danica]|nr:hypothetical protein B566_EDAN002727 [Ephemera danica]